MTKKFDFNWRIPVPEPLLQGNSFDKWTEVSWKTFNPFFLFLFLFFFESQNIADVSARRNCKTSTYIKGGRKSKESRPDVIDFFFSLLPPGAPYSNSKFFLLFSLIFHCFFSSSFPKNWIYFNLFLLLPQNWCDFAQPELNYRLCVAGNDKGICQASENKYLPLFSFSFFPYGKCL